MHALSRRLKRLEGSLLPVKGNQAAKPDLLNSLMECGYTAEVAAWLALLEAMAPRLQGCEAEVATECAKLLQNAVARGEIGDQICYYCHGMLLGLCRYIHAPTVWRPVKTPAPPRFPDDPLTYSRSLSEIDELQTCLQIDRWRLQPNEAWNDEIRQNLASLRGSDLIQIIIEGTELGRITE